MASLQETAQHEGHPNTLEESLFVGLKRATGAGYNASATGIDQELEYPGNTYPTGFPGCSQESLQAQDTDTGATKGFRIPGP